MRDMQKPTVAYCGSARLSAPPNNETACGFQRIERAGDEKQVISLQWPKGLVYSQLHLYRAQRLYYLTSTSIVPSDDQRSGA